jgi:thiamine-monophosphate kinase
VNLAALGEFGFIERIRRRAASAPAVRVAIGDDCAALCLPAGELLLTTTDLLIEDIHFRRSFTDLKTLGRKSVAVNVSDIAAMGGVPRYLYLGLGVPADLCLEDLDAFIDGFLEAAASYGAVLAGGDTCRSPGPLLISVTAEGSVAEGELVRRSGAAVGDDIYLSGSVGDSALALHHLQRGEVPASFLAARHHDPTARTVLGRSLAEARLPSAMIDVSDGVLADLGHLLEASRVGALLEEEALPLSALFREGLAADPSRIELAWSGGEDYELLFTVRAGQKDALSALARRLNLPLTRIGTVTAGAEGLSVRTGDGRLLHPAPAGFNHFLSGGQPSGN